MHQRNPSETDTPGFQSVDPWKSKELTYTRRNLPHLQAPGATYFVTVRCNRGIQLLDRTRDLIMAAIEACNGTSIDLDAAVVMPDHVHAIFRLIEPYKLSRVLQLIKGRSARQVNQFLQQSHRLKPVPLWMDESFDHIVRTEAEWHDTIEYIHHNPVKNGLVSSPAQYKWLYVRPDHAKPE
jgi:REP element-mobilizing transposase RayT